MKRNYCLSFRMGSLRKKRKKWYQNETLRENNKKKRTEHENIARGTTDPGYWVYNSNHFYDRNQTNKQTRCFCMSHLHIWNISWNLICISLKYTFSDLLEIGSKFGQWMTSLALVPKLATRLSHFHCHIALDCHIGIISLYWVGSLIS